jgi:hypothetical protein
MVLADVELARLDGGACKEGEEEGESVEHGVLEKWSGEKAGSALAESGRG